MAESTTQTKNQKAINAWKGKRTADITLPTGTQVTISLPDLPEMIRAGRVPNELLAAVNNAAEGLSAGTGAEIDLDEVREATDFMRWMVATTVQNIDLDPVEDVPELPAEDRDMILEFAMRARIVDAVGHHFHGLESVASWRKFHLGE